MTNDFLMNINKNQRNKVVILLESLKENKLLNVINKIYIFGSSVRDDWEPGSDLDIAIDFKCKTEDENFEWTDEVIKTFKIINDSIKTRFDFIILNDEDIIKSKNLYYNIINKGVKIYEQ
jgi:predicted nucleotidyltransferase